MSVFWVVITKVLGGLSSLLGLVKGAWVGGIIKNLLLGLWNNNKLSWLNTGLSSLGVWFLNSWRNNKKNWVIGFLSVAVIVLGVLLWNGAHEKGETVTGTSQNEAETTYGVDVAALNAKLELQESQLKEATAEIERLKKLNPHNVVYTTTDKVKDTVEDNRIKEGADFAVVTDPSNPDIHVDIDNVNPYANNGNGVTLYQYNVFAYKKSLKSLSVDTSDLKTVDTVTVGYSKRITKDGKYLGATLGYDIPDKQIKVGLKYTY